MVDLARAGVMLVSRIHAPEPAAASLRLSAVEAELVRNRIPVRVLTTTPPPGSEIDDPPGLQVSRWPALRDGDGQLRGYLPYMSFDIPLLLRVLTTRSPGAYLVEPPPTTGAVMRMLAGILNRPYVWYAADIWSDATEIAGAPKPVVKAVRWMEKFVLRGASGVVAISPGVAKRARELGATNVEIVPNGVDTNIFHPELEPVSATEQTEAGICGPYFIYAGTASEWQGADIFVNAMRTLMRDGYQAQLVYIGQGSALEEIKAQAAQLPALANGARPVVFLGQQPPQIAARWQVGATASLVSIIPGQGYDFAYPTKVLSALACGTPVIYAGVGPVTEDLRDATLGSPVAYRTEAVAAAMKTYLDTNKTLDVSARKAAAYYRHQWVCEHRSTTTVGREVTRILRQVAQTNR